MIDWAEVQVTEWGIERISPEDAAHVCSAFCRLGIHADRLFTVPDETRQSLMDVLGGRAVALTGVGPVEVIDVVRAGEDPGIAAEYAKWGKSVPPEAATHTVAWVMLLKPVV
ncbi:MAG: hypothetical protein JWP44_4503 [Mucilaginibacter sp.]|nr:hypothetical protein [Mucilaginibacter sp.]